MIVAWWWETRNDVIDLGYLDTRHCEYCKQETPFKLVLDYQHEGICGIFNCVMGQKYMLVCAHCKRGWDLTKADVELEVAGTDVELAIATSPIPFMNRFGLVLLGCAGVGVVVLIVCVAAMSGG